MRWSRATTKTLIKLGVFSAVCVVVALWLIVRIGNVQLFSSDVGYHAELTDASGLLVGDDVKVAGVTVGRVNSVGVVHGHALVGFDVEPKVHLSSTTGVGTEWLDVIGDKDLYLYPSSGGRELSPGATLPLKNDVGDASVGALLNALGPILQAINPKEQNAFLQAVASSLQGNDAEVHSLVDHTAEVSGTVGSVSAELGNLIDNLSTVVSAIAAHRGDVASLADDLASLSHTVQSNNGVLDSTVTNLGSAEKDLAQLLAHNSSHLDSLITSLNSISKNLAQHKSELAKSIHTLPQGLAPYEQISAYGQWFEIDTVFTCIANQTVCSYQSPTDQPGGKTNPLPGAPSAGDSGGLPGYLGTLAGGAP